MELGPASEPFWADRLARTPFAPALAKGAPLFVACGEPPQVAFATSAALSAFGVADARALQNVLFAADSLGSRRLLRLAAEMTEEAAPRLETLRFFVARRALTTPWLCARFRRDGETFFVAADPAAPGESAEAAPATAAEPSARFVWRLDGEDRFGPPDAALAERLGALAPRSGETLEALQARTGVGPEWAAAIAARQTFSRLRALWPEPGRERARIVFVSGAPVLAAGVRYNGFRGFGVFTGERVALPKPPAKAPPPRPALVKPVAGDAAALIGLLQRQNAPALGSPAGSANGPALAIISALAALLQPRGGEAKGAAAQPKPDAPAQPAPEPAAPSGAEIVVLRPHAVADAASPRESESVALTSQERDAFKEIARALGVNVRSPRHESEAPAQAEPAGPSHGPAADDLAALLDHLPIAALVTRGGEALYANRTLLDLTGYADLDDFRDREGLKTIFRGREPQALAPGGLVAGVPLVGAGDRILTVDAQVRATVWQGAPAELVAMRRSREADHRAELRALERETAMHAARARDLAAALEAARDGMVRLDREGRILGLNRGAEKLFGCDQKEIAGENVLSLFGEEAHTALSAALEVTRRADSGPVEKLEAPARRRDGTEFPARLDFGRLANQPEPDLFLLLTDLSRVEESDRTRAAIEGAERSSAAKSELLSRVSHEMRTPLHAILGFAEVILEERMGPLGNERYRDYIKNIHDSGRHVLSLANDLLDLTRIELGKMDLQFSPIDVNGVVRECVTLMQPQAARERVIVRLSLFDRLPNVMADERSLRQIMLNLMANAVKYNEPGGQVIVSTALDEEGSVILRVRDTGVGMNESELAIALEPFRRVPGVKASEGSGLGLPLTKALVEANHAGFSIKSRKDQGTLVEIAFPVRRAAQ
jgi:PAS domain S-box-containing protein